MIYKIFENYGIKYINIKIFNFISISSFLFFIIIFDSYKTDSFGKEYKKIKEFEDLHTNSFITNFFNNPILHMKKFRNINCKNILLNKFTSPKNEYPDISVIITIYNQASCFHCALRSVQNQSLKNIEIIIIDDYSIDNSINLIEKYMKEDNRIIYLRHNSTKGTIKSRSDGVRISKGRYITIIDGDDSLNDENILFNCLSIANLADLDIVGFDYAIYRRKEFMGLNKNYKNIKGLYKKIIYQPELSNKFIDYDERSSFYGFVNRNIWAKLVKNKIFKKTLEFIGAKYIEDFILEYEDTIMSFSLFRIAKSFYYMAVYGYYYATEECKISFPNLKLNKELDPIKYLNFLLDIFKGKEIENFLLYKELIGIDYYKQLDKLINDNFSYVYQILEKIKKYNSHSKERIDKISKIKSKLMKKEILIKISQSL